jgi:hypothetical protein
MRYFVENWHFDVKNAAECNKTKINSAYLLVFELFKVDKFRMLILNHVSWYFMHTTLRQTDSIFQSVLLHSLATKVNN